MSDCCSGACTSAKPPVDPRYRRILWIALVINAAMFGVEFSGSLVAHSISLLADAVDFLGDAINYALSLFVLGLAPIWRSRAALSKGLVMGGYALLVLARIAWGMAGDTLPGPAAMSMIALAALTANGTVALLLYAFRNGDADMRSVWLCTRNDVIGNIAVLLAAAGVFGTGQRWPDMVVALVMALLGLSTARTVILHSRQELLGAK